MDIIFPPLILPVLSVNIDIIQPEIHYSLSPFTYLEMRAFDSGKVYVAHKYTTRLKLTKSVIEKQNAYKFRIKPMQIFSTKIALLLNLC